MCLVWHVSGIPFLVSFALITMQLILLIQLTYGCSFSLGHMVPLETQIVVEKNPSTSADAKEVIAVVMLVPCFPLLW